MGIIQRQSVKGTAFSYLGAGLGIAITGFLLPLLFKSEQVGLVNILVAYAVLFAQFASLGFNGVTVRLFPYFRDKKSDHHGFLGLGIIITLIGFILSVLVLFLIEPLLVQNNAEKSPLLVEYLYYIIPILFAQVFFGFFDTYYSAVYNASIGFLYKEVMQRVFILISIGLFFTGLVDFQGFMILYMVAVSFPTILIIWSLARKGHLHLRLERSFITRTLRKEMISVSWYSILNSLTGIVIQNIDMIMVNALINLKTTGFYAINFFFGSLVRIPSRSLIKISNIVLADSWKNNDLDNIRTIYHKSTRTQLALGLVLFLLMWASLPDIYSIIPKNYEQGKWVAFYIGLASLVEITNSVSKSILGTSIYYRAQTAFMAFLAVMVVGLNFLFIPLLGMMGASLAAFLALFLANLGRFLFIWIRLGIQPYGMQHLRLLVIAAVFFLAITYTPYLSYPIIDLILRSAIIGSSFVFIVYKMNFSEDINEMINKILSWVFAGKK